MIKKLTPKEIEAQKMIVAQVENSLDALYNSCREFANEMKVESIPVNYIKMAKDQFLSTYKESVFGKKQSIKDRVKSIDKKK